MNYMTTRRRPTGRRLGAVVAGLALVIGACDNPLNTLDPDIVLPEDLEGAEAIPTILQGAVGDFALAYAGEATPTIGVTMFSGLMSDEFVHSGTFTNRAEFETRTLDIRNAELTTLFRNLQRARRSAERAAQFVEDNAADPTSATSQGQMARMFNLAGYSYLFVAENFCSGVPFSEVGPDEELIFGDPLTTTQMFDRAIERFASAADAAVNAGSTREELIAMLGTARALLGKGDLAGAGATAAAVPVDFRFDLEHSINSTRQENGIYFVNVVNERWSVADGEAGNGLAFRGGAGTMDIRIPWVRTAGGADVGFDNATPQYDLLKYPGRDKLSTVGTGVEAQLMQAEAALEAQQPGSWLQILNDLRANVANLLTRDHLDILRDQFGIEGAAVALGQLADPGTDAGRVDLHFQERAFWLYATANRMSDMRRLIRQYGRDADAVFPSGAYFKGGTYGTDVNFPVVLDEENNPNFQQCLNRDA